MQLEDLQQQWQRLDHKLDQSLQLETELLRQAVVPPARRRVNRLVIWPALDIGFCVAAQLLAGTFLGNHWGDWLLVVPSVVIMIAAIALLIDSVCQLVRVTQVDWCGPVVEIQSSLERLRVAKIRQFKWIILFSPLVGFCVLIVGAQGLLDWLSDSNVKLLEKFDFWWIVGNFAFGVLFIPLGYSVARILAKRFRGRRWWQAALDDIAGNSIKTAARELDRWASLQRETKETRGLSI